jgi:serine/threonine protein phosphatase PrpC
LVATVADGAGSAAHAEVGAALAAQTAVDTLCVRLAQLSLPQDDTAWRTLLTETIEAARAALDTEALGRGIQVRDLATTLILLIALPSLVAVMQIGDGAAVVGDETGNILALTTPPSGEYLLGRWRRPR